MSRQSVQWCIHQSRHGREATLAQIVEAIDRTALETKSALADDLDLSEHYVSELLQELKGRDLVKKAYVVDQERLFEEAPAVSSLYGTDTTENGQIILELLEGIEQVTNEQYAAARATFVGETPERTAGQLEPLTNERTSALLNELKSFTLSTEWPGNRVAAEFATIARNLELVGDRACFVSDVVEDTAVNASGVIEERLLEVFETGERINEYVRAILFDCDLDSIDSLYAAEERVHRNINELFELVTAYDTDVYGYLVSITRALERAIYYWVDTAEIAVQLHVGIELEHLTMGTSA
ncbi:PhoU family transcriptional regulator [Natronorubrum aibiense]|uniref:PhoU family transcriptional regulator n=1 Tax=Natronorubrum aibiense TaxID=348826 RepID=A0A5P9P9Q4_9EURY|nr:PhoU family transcriptional regulator [Natronorubrum aibiense]QFU84832.1 PhoU family transcriptional regulator [Natronorubrum aibiense]